MKINDLGSIREESLDNFIYVIGSARGGTSIVRDALGIHDQLLSFPLMVHFMNQVWRYRNKIHQRLLRQVFQMPVQKMLENIDEDAVQFIKKNIDTALQEKNLKKLWQMYALIFGLLDENSNKADKITGWVDKANDCYGLKAILKYFPDCKFVFVFRDPRSAVLSLSKRIVIRNYQEEKEVLDPQALVEACIYWRNMTQKMLYFCKRYPENSIQIRFEDFLLSSEKTLNKIFQFVNVPELDSDIISNRLKKLYYGTSNEKDESGSGISKKPLSRWEQILSVQEQKLIHTLTGTTAKKVGYDMGAGNVKSDFFNLINIIPDIQKKSIIASKLLYLSFFEFVL